MSDVIETTELHDVDLRLTQPSGAELQGRYEILAQAGHSPLSTVYRVKDIELQREFALKVLNDDNVSLELLRTRCKEEARALVDLTHHGIGSIHGYGETSDGCPYLLLDWISGHTLQVELQKGPLEVGRAINVFIQLCEAIQHAHFKGFIHQDIKPSNIMLSTDGAGNETIKVIDFGVARILDISSKDDTATGAMCGTPLYMSPEQCSGANVDKRSDIYSLGAVMYEALCGRPPFNDANVIKVMLKHINEQPVRLNKVMTSLDTPERLKQSSTIVDWLSELVLCCLEKNPSKRYQHIDEVLQDLIAIRDGRKPSFITKCQPLVPRRIAASVIDGLIMATIYIIIWSVIWGHAAPVVFTPCVHAIVALFWGLLLGPALGIVIFIAWLTTPAGYAWSYVTLATGFSILLGLVYAPLWESSSLKATPGKLLFGLQVVTAEGKRLPFLPLVFDLLTTRILFGSEFTLIALLRPNKGLGGLLRTVMQTIIQPVSETDYLLDRLVIDRGGRNLPAQAKISTRNLYLATRTARQLTLLFSIGLTLTCHFFWLILSRNESPRAIFFTLLLFTLVYCAGPCAVVWFWGRKELRKRLNERTAMQGPSYTDLFLEQLNE